MTTGAVKTPLLEVAGLAHRYGRRLVLRDVSFTAGPGELIGVLGANGAGKSTLLRLLLRFGNASSGLIRLEGRALEAHRREELARRVAFVPQSLHLDFDFTVREVVEMGRLPYHRRARALEGADREVVTAALRMMELEELVDRPVTALSGGERQRVVIARALAQDTSVLVLDEPTANLDLLHAYRVLALLRARAGTGHTVLAALHDLHLAARFCTRVLLLDRGSLVADAPPAEALTPTRLREVFGVLARTAPAPDGGVRIEVDGPS